MNQKTIGYVVEGAGAVAVLAGCAVGFHHLAFSVPAFVGLLAIYVGRKMSSGSITL